MGDQDMVLTGDADWSQDSPMDESSPVVAVRAQRYDDLDHMEFASHLRLQILPNDWENSYSDGFDLPSRFCIGDPNVHFHAAAAQRYPVSGATGKPVWNSLFGFILARLSHLRFLSTVYVLVDDRDLKELDQPEPSLKHWPAVAAWWSSRACLLGPAQESSDVVFVPISEASGLHLVHPTWAGTFVLAALCLVFPGLNIVLLDSDCVPVTLFEVEDLWREAQSLQHHGYPSSPSTSSWAGVPDQDSSTPTSGKKQGVILVTEHNAEVNAGFVVLNISKHDALLSEEDWGSIPLVPGDRQDQAVELHRPKLEAAYWQLVSRMCSSGRDDRHMSPAECQAWIQTGLALTPFCGHIMQTSLEWAVAWSLVGEWTTRTIFLPWPRQGHPSALVSPYDQRSVPLLTWARACFEQGSLPSLLALPGDAALLVLPGDGMFQAQRVVSGRCRPVILHGYGGAKKEMPASLAALAKFGWIPMATAMMGSASSPPQWANKDWRPILGTSVDIRLLPPFSQWIRVPRDELHIHHATNSWLKPDKVNVALGPDCDQSPHSLRQSTLDLTAAPYIPLLFGKQRADRKQYNTAQAKAVTDQLWFISNNDDTRRVSPFRPTGPQPPPRCRRFAFGYALDGSEFPCYLVWPLREARSYALLDTATNDTIPLTQESLFRPLGMQHFYDAFGLSSQICVRSDALVLYGFKEDELMSDLHITREGLAYGDWGPTSLS